MRTTIAAWSKRFRLAGVASVGLCAAFVGAAPRGAQMKVTAKVEEPKIIAVRFRHDMCPHCAAFDPRFPKLVEQAGSESVLFVTLDLTSGATQRQAARLVAALNLERIWPGDLSKIGTIEFVHGRSKVPISSVRAEDVETVHTALRDALDAADSP